MGRENTQLCWDCKNACGNCSWSKDFKPVKGWKAKKIRINDATTGGIDSYSITKCPLFISDNPKGLKFKDTNIKKAQEMGLSLRTYYRWKSCGKI